MKCRKCRSTDNLNISSTRLSKTGELGYSYVCRKCNRKRIKAYRATKAGKVAARRATANYERKHPERVTAWIKAQVVNKKPCLVCNTKLNIHRHHPNPLKPLDIISLCSLHHREVHNQASRVIMNL